LRRLVEGRALLLAVFLLTLPLVTPKIRGADEIEYFSYLHSMLLDHDLEFGNEYQHFFDLDPRGLQGFKSTFLDLREPRTGRHINFAPLGAAVLWAPFYLSVHAGLCAAQALGMGVAADGYSRAYVWAVCGASALYGFLGLLLIHDALRRFGGFAEPTASWTVVAVWLGTPVLYYMTLAPGFSHADSLFAVALLLWLWLRARGRPEDTPADWIGIGLAGGLAGLVREQDVLFLAAPALDLLLRVRRTGRLRPALLRGFGMAAAALVLIVPQLLVYHVLNGRFGPSILVARKMSFSSPHFLQVLLDPGHGLFLWAPLLLVGTVGLGLRFRRQAEIAAPLLLALLLQIWINGSVESWTQAGAFGSRRFVSASFVFAWGLAALVSLAVAQGRRGLTAVTLGLFVWWNVSLMLQFGLRLMDRQRLEWPRVAANQVVEVPRHLGRVLLLFFTDRERLLREGA
jgi:hypothetical protein